MKTTPVYLASYLEPLAPILSRPDVTDIYVNRPNEIWIETLGGATERIEQPDLTAASLSRLSRQIAALTHQGISREHPLLSGALPDGSRIQIVAPPATRADLALAIRKHVSAGLSLNDYASTGALETTRTDRLDAGKSARGRVNEILGRAGVVEALRLAVRTRLNILVSGGTSTGKTTFLNALLGEIDLSERLIFLEDTPELRIGHPNALGFIAARSALGEASVTTEDLLNASLRMRPDRIILGELRGPEAYSFLRAINTGHPGSMTTVHADSPERAIEQIALLVLQAGTRLGRDDVIHYVRSTIDVFVQLDRVAGRRRVAAVIVKDD